MEDKKPENSNQINPSLEFIDNRGDNGHSLMVLLSDHRFLISNSKIQGFSRVENLMFLNTFTVAGPVVFDDPLD